MMRLTNGEKGPIWNEDQCLPRAYVIFVFSIQNYNNNNKIIDFVEQTVHEPLFHIQYFVQLSVRRYTQRSLFEYNITFVFIRVRFSSLKKILIYIQKGLIVKRS